MPKRDLGSTGSKMSPQKKSTDAIQMLKEDHRKVEALFDQFLEEKSGKKQQLAQRIFHELELHATLEEEIFYPALQNLGNPAELSLEQGGRVDGEEAMDESELDAGEDIGSVEDPETSEGVDEDLITHAYDEHRTVRDMIAQLRNNDASSLEFRQSMIELQQTVEDHVFEEEDELFAQAQLSVDTKTLGMQMQQRKQEILAAAA